MSKEQLKRPRNGGVDPGSHGGPHGHWGGSLGGTSGEGEKKGEGPNIGVATNQLKKPMFKKQKIFVRPPNRGVHEVKEIHEKGLCFCGVRGVVFLLGVVMPPTIQTHSLDATRGAALVPRLDPRNKRARTGEHEKSRGAER